MHSLCLLLLFPHSLCFTIQSQVLHTVYIQIFEGCNFQGFCGRLGIRKIFILEISLAKIWLASIGEQDMRLRLTLAREDSKFQQALPAVSVKPGSLEPRSGRGAG